MTINDDDDKIWRPPPCSLVRTTPLPSVQHIDYKSTDYRTALSLNSRRPLIQIVFTNPTEEAVKVAPIVIFLYCDFGHFHYL